MRALVRRMRRPSSLPRLDGPNSAPPVYPEGRSVLRVAVVTLAALAAKARAGGGES